MKFLKLTSLCIEGDDNHEGEDYEYDEYVNPSEIVRFSYLEVEYEGRSCDATEMWLKDDTHVVCRETSEEIYAICATLGTEMGEILYRTAAPKRKK
jgi:hypothetical protein